MTLPLVLRRKFHIIPVLVFQKPVPRGNGLGIIMSVSSSHGMNPLCLTPCFVNKFTKFVVE